MALTLNFLTRSSSRSPEDRVAAGARVMDGVNPEWFWNIDLKELNLTDCYNCVIGQLHGEFYKGCTELNFTKAMAAAGGFNIAEPMDYESDLDAEYTELTALWRQEIIRRREEVTGMNIGEEAPAIVVEPIDVPDTAPAPEEAPEMVPVPVPAKETVPA